MKKVIKQLRSKIFSPFTFHPSPRPQFTAHNLHLTTLAAFTLSEVLITLGIIGVVAAMTIPNLVQNYQKTQYATAAKKAYTQMNQVLQQMAVDNGTVGSIADYFGDTATAGAKIASYYKVVKTCGTSETDTSCFAPFDNYYDGSAHSTVEWTNAANKYYKFVTTDGMSFSIFSWDNSCTSNRGFSTTPDSPTYKSTCGSVYIDVNGAKKPNYYGRDVFLFYIISKITPLLYPCGGFYTSTSDTGTTVGGGEYWWNYSNHNYCGAGGKYGPYCAGRLMENGWVMDY